eukprot:g5169.t1
MSPQEFPRPRGREGSFCVVSVLRTTVDQETLKKALAPHQRVAVLGNSHSAAVSLAKLGDLAVPLSLRVGCFGRRPLRCAEWLPQHDMYRYTSTGLKGFGAVFGRECMAKGTEWLEIKDMKDPTLMRISGIGWWTVPGISKVLCRPYPG